MIDVCAQVRRGTMQITMKTSAAASAAAASSVKEAAQKIYALYNQSINLCRPNDIYGLLWQRGMQVCDKRMVSFK